MTNKNFLFTSESVSEGHPDKLCDRVSDAILDRFILQEETARVACETFATTNRLLVGGEVGISDPGKLETLMSSIEDIARACVKDIGYNQDGFHCTQENRAYFHHNLRKQPAEMVPPSLF